MPAGSGSSGSCWNFAAPPKAGPTEDHQRESSNDSLKCTKWENINAKPLENWSSSGANPNNWNATNLSAAAGGDATNACWPNPNDQQAVAVTSWPESKSWSTTPMDSSVTLQAPPQTQLVSAEMTPVNPKEVSPMDVDEMLRGLSNAQNNPQQMEATSVMSKMSTTLASNLPGGDSNVSIMSTYTSC